MVNSVLMRQSTIPELELCQGKENPDDRGAGFQARQWTLTSKGSVQLCASSGKLIIFRQLYWAVRIADSALPGDWVASG